MGNREQTRSRNWRRKNRLAKDRHPQGAEAIKIKLDYKKKKTRLREEDTYDELYETIDGGDE